LPNRTPHPNPAVIIAVQLTPTQQFIISILVGHNILKPSIYMTYYDIDTALASLILACEMPIFAALIFVAFAPAPYTRNGAAASPLSAIVDAFNITDLLSAFVRGPMRLVRDQQRQIMRQDSMRVELEPGEMGTGEERRWKEPRMSSAV
jgi:hypothetical protein